VSGFGLKWIGGKTDAARMAGRSIKGIALIPIVDCVKRLCECGAIPPRDVESLPADARELLDKEIAISAWYSFDAHVALLEVLRANSGTEFRELFRSFVDALVEQGLYPQMEVLERFEGSSFEEFGMFLKLLCTFNEQLFNCLRMKVSPDPQHEFRYQLRVIGEGGVPEVVGAATEIFCQRCIEHSRQSFRWLLEADELGLTFRMDRDLVL
jgi:hypothetical protein